MYLLPVGIISNLNHIASLVVQLCIPRPSHSLQVALITADASSHSVQTAFPLPSASHSHSPAGRSLLGFVELQSFSSVGAALANSTYTGPQYITSNIWLGLMVGFFLLFTLGVGVTVISSIEAPVRFPRRVFVVKKEY